MNQRINERIDGYYMCDMLVFLTESLSRAIPPVEKKKKKKNEIKQRKEKKVKSHRIFQFIQSNCKKKKKNCWKKI